METIFFLNSFKEGVLNRTNNTCSSYDRIYERERKKFSRAQREKNVSESSRDLNVRSLDFDEI